MPHVWQPAEYSHAAKHGSARFTGPAGEHFGTLDFQDGSPYEHGTNGVTNEEVIQVVIERLEALNTDPFVSQENSMALTCLRLALGWLENRTRRLAEKHPNTA